MGVQYLCIMIGWIYMSIVTGGLLLSSVIALTACVIPGYYTAASIVSTTLGNSITPADDFHLHHGVHLPEDPDR